MKMENNTEILPLAIVASLTLFLLVTIFITLLVIIQNRRIKNKLHLKELEDEFVLELSKAESEATQNTMQEIGRELHDNVGQILAASQIGLMNLFGADFENNEVQRELVATLEHGINEVNRIGRSLNKDFWNSQSLFDSIGAESGRLERLGHLVVHVNQSGENDALESSERTILYRVFQEVIHNILKHSESKMINIELRSDPFFMEISDSGVGFDVSKAEGGSGIVNIHKRCQLINVHSELTSSEDSGTVWKFSKL